MIPIPIFRNAILNLDNYCSSIIFKDARSKWSLPHTYTKCMITWYAKLSMEWNLHGELKFRVRSNSNQGDIL
jgi:hypothetical protein